MSKIQKQLKIKPAIHIIILPISLSNQSLYRKTYSSKISCNICKGEVFLTFLADFFSDWLTQLSSQSGAYKIQNSSPKRQKYDLTSIFENTSPLVDKTILIQ